MLLHRLTPRRVWVGILLTAVALHVVASQITMPHFVFSGFLLNSIDPWGYRGFSRCFATGGPLIDNPFAPTSAPPAFFNLLWFLVGKTQALFGLPFLPVYYTLGVVASGLLYAALAAVTREFLGDGPRARLAFLLAGLGAGFGWVTGFFSDELTSRLASFDIYSVEAYPLKAALFFPHLALSTAVLIATLLLFNRGVATGRRRFSLAAAALQLALGFFHPYHMVTVSAVAGTWVALEQALAPRSFFRGWVDLVLLGAATLPPLFYYRWLFHQPNWNMWSDTNVFDSSVSGVLLGLGPMLLLAAIGVWRGGREYLARHRFPLAWGVVGLCLLFSFPLVLFAGKLVEGLIVPLAILGSGAVFGRDLPYTPRRRIGAALLLLALLPSTALLAARSLQVVNGKWKNFFPVDWTEGAYVYEGDLAVMGYLEKHPLRNALLMVINEEGQMLPAAADVRVFASWNHTTPDAAWRRRNAEWFYSAQPTSQERYALLKQVGATHVWYSPAWDFGFEPGTEPYLEPVFVNAGSGIWRIDPGRRRETTTPGD